MCEKELENSTSKKAETLETKKKKKEMTCRNTSLVTNSYQQLNNMKDYSAWTLF